MSDGDFIRDGDSLKWVQIPDVQMNVSESTVTVPPIVFGNLAYHVEGRGLSDIGLAYKQGMGNLIYV